MKGTLRGCVAALCVFVAMAARPAGAQGGQGMTYYIDYDGGRDGAGGTTAATAFKHCPGDPAARENAKALVPRPGDTLVFKGGVVYRGTVVVTGQGEEGKPVVYDGNPQGAFGRGRAVVDGSELLGGWQACRSAEECGGNPNWKSIFFTWVPGDLDPWGANLFEDDRMLWAAQEPNLKDSFYIDDLATYRKAPEKQVTTTTLADSSFFTQADPKAWDGATLFIWAPPNLVYARKITGFDPATATIVFQALGGVYKGRDTLYAVSNSLRVLDAPGEFVVSGERDAQGRAKLYLWPLTPGDPAQKEVTYSARRNGINVNGKSWVTIRGFIIQKQGGPDQVIALSNSGGGTTKGLVVRENEVRWNRCRERTNAVNLPGLEGALIERNSVHENGRARGLAFNNGVEVTVSNNVLDKNGGTGIAFFGCKKSVMSGNTVTRHNGVHANALTVYSGSEDVLVFGNKVFDSNIALTTQESRNVTIACNILTGMQGYIVADWSKCDGLKFFNNVILAEKAGQSSAVTMGLDTVNVVFKNNICSGHVISRCKGPAELANNLYTALSFAQKKPLEAGSLEFRDLAAIFVDPAKRDYRLKPGSPAIDAGVDVGLEKDIAGTKIPQGKAPDIGAYEAVPER